MSICFRLLYLFPSYQSLLPSFFPQGPFSLIFAPECCTVNTPSKELNLDLWLRTGFHCLCFISCSQKPSPSRGERNGISIDGWYLALIRQAASWAEDIRVSLKAHLLVESADLTSTFKWDSLTHTAHNLRPQTGYRHSSFDITPPRDNFTQLFPRSLVLSTVFWNFYYSLDLLTEFGISGCSSALKMIMKIK